MKHPEFDETKLNTPAQEAVRTLVSHLPEENLSLAWRSELNEKLMRQTARRRRMILWGLRPAFGLALAGVLAAVVLIPSPTLHRAPISPAPGRLEAEIVQDHVQSVELADVVGAGLNPLESHKTSGYTTDGGDWSDIDMDSL